MCREFKWTKETYEASVTSRCWCFTAYDAGWDESQKHGANLSADDELGQIVAMELNLGKVPEWARRIVKTSIRLVPPCGHYLFPMVFLEAVSAIGSETPTEFAHGCYTVDRKQKKAMQDYCLCLDAWLAGAPPEATAKELNALGYRKIDWNHVCAELWKVLGERTELKELLVERLLHSQRWKIKSRPWDDDLVTDFGRDQYLGNYSETGCDANLHGFIEHPLLGIDEGSSPKVKTLEARLVEICPDWEWFQYTIRYGWLCSPKAFRHLECLIWSIGKGRKAVTTRDHPIKDGDKVPGFLQCEDTYLNQDEAAAWWRAFLKALGGWWQGKPVKGKISQEVHGRLRETTPVKRWLVRLFVRRLEILERDSGSLGLLVNPSPRTKRGTKPLWRG